MNRRRRPERNGPVLAAVLGLGVWAAAFAIHARAEDFSTSDWARQWTYTAIHVADWGTTLDIKNHPDLQEINPLLGHHPSDARINTYMAGTLAAHWAISYALPERWRPTWQYVTIGIDGAVVAHNFSLGLRLAF